MGFRNYCLGVQVPIRLPVPECPARSLGRTTTVGLGLRVCAGAPNIQIQ